VRRRFLRSRRCRVLNSNLGRPELRVAWQHEYGDRAYPIDSQFASDAGGLFTVCGLTNGRDSALVSTVLRCNGTSAFPRTLTATDNWPATNTTATTSAAHCG